MIEKSERTNDHFSIWSIASIVLVVCYSVFFNNFGDTVAKHFSKHKAVSTGTVTTDAFQRLIIIDSEVKQAYLLQYLANSGFSATLGEVPSKITRRTFGQPPLSPFHQKISDALDDSSDGLLSNPDSMFFARRVILLRLVLDKPPFGPVSGDGRHKGMSSPLNAYELAAKDNPVTATQARDQENLWRSAFSKPSISRSELAANLQEIHRHPTLLFYNLIASQYLYSAAGDAPTALRISRYLDFRGLLFIAGIGSVSLVALTLFLVGVIVWIGAIFSIRRQSAESEDKGPNIFDRFLVPAPERVNDDKRKLRAGDLLDCFAMYLIALNGVGIIFSLLIDHIPHPDFSRMSDLQLIYWNIGLDLVSYVAASGAALAILLLKAKKTGASLGDELGLSTKNLLRNLAFGAAGWGASLVLMLSVNGAIAHVLHKLPDPENPALPLLGFAPDTISRFLLFGLAAIAAPFFEETFFRGVLLNGLLLRFQPIYACLITGFLFGSVHPVGVVEGVSLAALGAVFAWMAYLRKSLAPSMFAHFLQNSFAYLSVYFSFAILYRF